jgi:hypothetical protein
MRKYANRLRSELNDFIGNEVPKQHEVSVIYDRESAMIQVDLVRGRSSRSVSVLKADAVASHQMQRTRDRLRKERSQWVYFDRSLRIYEESRVFSFKPMQLFHWTESQAMSDAREIIGETLSGGEVKE